MATRETPRTHNHSHLWLVGLIGVAAGLVLLIYVPSLPAVSGVFLLFGGFHLIGALVLMASLYVLAGNRLARRLPGRIRRQDTANFDFGWAPAWALGPWIAALILAAIAVAVQVATPAYWPLAMVLTLLAANFFAGGLIARTVGRYEHAALPLVDLLSGDAGVVLDAGCGAGRTTIALGRALRNGRVVALDRFDSDYIEGGGRRLLEQNLRLAGLTGRVDIELGDLTALPFPEGRFDAAVSAHAIDHLGPQKQQGLREILRVLKPGGRFLLVVWVPGWTMFAIVSVLALLFSGKGAWRRMAASAGFELCDEGMLNGNWFVVLKKPIGASRLQQDEAEFHRLPSA
ncbi:class I SAM-dependent methyltransferase [Mesorhizobium sp. M0293]|uniref:class I SAM-dependent methyltransferase n=1 Tax=unclassified Mesorhizobium TaxID=325217 RepID=UPI003339C76A